MIENYWDLIVVFVYLGFIIAVAFHAGKDKRTQKQNINEQYLAGKSLSLWESLFSIIATETSALTFLGIPAVAIKGNFSFLQIYMGAIFGRFVIAKYLLPKVYNKGLTVYSGIAQGSSQKIMSFIFIISKLMSVGVRLYSGSILIGIFFNLSPYTAVMITLGLTFIYTLFGGLKAVVRTDMVQMFLFLLGGIVAHFMIPHIADQTWSSMILEAYQAGKTSIQIGSSPWGYITGIIAGFLFDMTTHGTDQDFMQRLLASKSLKRAQNAIFYSGFASLTIGTLFMGVGALLWSYIQNSPLPVEITPDKSFAYFITHYFPTGLKGLMLAGILAATMSTVDSTINAICACLQIDIFTKRKKSLSFYLKRDSVLASLGLLIVAVIASHSEGVLKMGLTVHSWTAGGMLSYFMGHLLINNKPKLTTMIISFSASLLGVITNTFIFEQSWHWNTYWGLALGLGSYYLLERKQEL